MDPDIANYFSMHCFVVLTALFVFALNVNELDVDLTRSADDVHGTEDHLVQMAVFKQVSLVSDDVFDCWKDLLEQFLLEF